MQLLKLYKEIDAQILAEKDIHNEFSVNYENISTNFTQLKNQIEGVNEVQNRIISRPKDPIEVTNATEVLR